MKLYSYIIARDYGFAPNPFYAWCTLATCKPGIRGSAEIGDWIIGTGAKTKYSLAGHLIYAMKTDEILDFNAYWNDARFQCKKPILNGSLKQIYGDNIYHSDGESWQQANSHHSLDDGQPNLDNIRTDTTHDRLLISRRFIYYGEKAPLIPAQFRPFRETEENICCERQGYKVFSSSMVVAFEHWLENLGEWGLQGMPLEYCGHNRVGV